MIDYGWYYGDELRRIGDELEYQRTGKLPEYEPNEIHEENVTYALGVGAVISIVAFFIVSIFVGWL